MHSIARACSRLALVGVLVGFFLALTSCNAVMDLLGVTEDKDSREEQSPLIADTDWSDSRYDSLGSISGSGTISVSSEHAGRPLLYVVTNSGLDQRTVEVPYGSLQSSVSASSFPSTGDPKPSKQTPRAIRGIPGQFDYPDLVDAGSGPGSGEIFASEAGSSPTWNVGDTFTFQACEGEVSAVVMNTVTDGDWSLYVWLDTDDTSVDSIMIEALSSRFMNPNSNSDIFDLVTSVFGEPWGIHARSNLIDPSRRDIHVLLYDIQGDGVPNGDGSRIVGYFDSRDNYVDGNGRLMFYLDAALLADTENKNFYDDGVWSADDYWPEEVISTLAHEFQHMIHYYQRSVVLGAEYSTWLNELFSMAAEEVVSRAIGVDGPRGVTASRGDAGPAGNWNGRISNHIVSGAFTDLLEWPGNNDQYVLDHYAASYSFGAFLMRTYGSAFFSAMLRAVNPSTAGIYEIAAVEEAGDRVIGQRISFDELLRRWGVAILVSDDTSVPAGYQMNSGTWIGDGSVAGSVGSLNAHNYRAAVEENGETILINGPLIFYADSGPFTTTPHSNLFLYAGTIPSAGTTLSFNLPSDVTVTAVMR